MISPIFKKEVQKIFEVIFSVIVLVCVILIRRFLGFSGGSDSKESACNAGDLGLIPGWGRSIREGNGNPLQYPCLENPMNKGVWWDTVHGVPAEQLSMHVRTHTHTHINLGID